MMLKRELVDLAVSWLVITLCFSAPQLLAGRLWAVGLYGLAVFTAFVLHELSHRTVARMKGFAAYYRAWYAGLAIALLISFASALAGLHIVFVLPGAVVVYPLFFYPSPRDIATIAAAGPFANIGVSVVAWILATLLPPSARSALSILAWVNAWLAFFNSLPLPPLDGFKVFRGNPPLWLAMICLSILCLALCRSL